MKVFEFPKCARVVLLPSTFWKDGQWLNPMKVKGVPVLLFAGNSPDFSGRGGASGQNLRQ